MGLLSAIRHAAKQLRPGRKAGVAKELAAAPTQSAAERGCSPISTTLQFEGVSGLLSIVVGSWLWRGSEV